MKYISTKETSGNGYTPIVIKNNNRAKYYDVLDLAHTTLNYEPFIKVALTDIYKVTIEH